MITICIVLLVHIRTITKTQNKMETKEMMKETRLERALRLEGLAYQAMEKAETFAEMNAADIAFEEAEKEVALAKEEESLNKMERNEIVLVDKKNVNGVWIETHYTAKIQTITFDGFLFGQGGPNGWRGSNPYTKTQKWAVIEPSENLPNGFRLLICSKQVIDKTIIGDLDVPLFINI